MAEAKDLVRLGCRQYERVQSNISYLGCSMEVTTESPHDEYEFRMLAAMRGVALNSEQLPMLKFEAYAFKPGTIPDTPAFLKISEIHLKKAKAARSTLANFISDCKTLRDMQRVVGSKMKVLKPLDKSIVLEFTFLTKYAESRITDRVMQQVMDALPTLEVRKELTQAMMVNRSSHKLMEHIAYVAILETPMCWCRVVIQSTFVLASSPSFGFY